MINVEIKIRHPNFGRHEIKTQISHSQTIRDLLRHMLQAYPEIAATCVDAENLCVFGEYSLIVNGRLFEAIGAFDYVLKDGDLLTFLASYKDG